MNADQAQRPLSLPVFLLLLGIVLAVCAVTLLVERHCARRKQPNRRGEYVTPRAPRGRL